MQNIELKHPDLAKNGEKTSNPSATSRENLNKIGVLKLALIEFAIFKVLNTVVNDF